jgi:hypothetical protein
MSDKSATSLTSHCKRAAMDPPSPPVRTPVTLRWGHLFTGNYTHAGPVRDIGLIADELGDLVTARVRRWARRTSAFAHD